MFLLISLKIYLGKVLESLLVNFYFDFNCFLLSLNMDETWYALYYMKKPIITN